MLRPLLIAIALTGALAIAQAADAPASATPATRATPAMPATPASATAPAAKASAAQPVTKSDMHKARRADCQKQAGARKGADHKAFMKDCMGRKKA